MLDAILSLLGVAAAGGGALWDSLVANSTWSKAAAQLGLRFRPGNLTGSRRIHGNLGRHDVLVTTHERGDKANTRYRIRYPSLGLGIVANRGQLAADDAQELERRLQGEQGERIHRILRKHRKVQVGDNELRYVSKKWEKSAETVVTTVRELDELARLLATGPVPQPPAAEPTPHVLVEEPDVPVLEPEAQIPAPAPVPVLVPVPVPVPGPVPRPLVPSRPIEEVVSRLFAEDRLSFETERVFDDDWAGTRVRGRGVLDRFELLVDGDDVFGPGPIAKAVLELPCAARDARPVRLVIALPVKQEPELAQRRGRSLDFEGTLAACDPYLRTLFVAG